MSSRFLESLKSDPQVADRDAFEAALKAACRELALAMLEEHPDRPASVVGGVMEYAATAALPFVAPAPKVSERYPLAKLNFNSLIDGRKLYIRHVEGRQPSRAELNAILDAAWVASRRVMLEAAPGILARIDEERGAEVDD